MIGSIAAALTLMGCTQARSAVQTEGYSAVFLDSGAVFFGQLTGYGTDYPVLKNAFYVQSAANPDTKQTSNVLVKRGKEWHGPDRMTINAHHIIFIENVTAGSQVASLIAQAH